MLWKAFDIMTHPADGSLLMQIWVEYQLSDTTNTIGFAD